MVNSDGQLYTIEGISAAMILLLTAYIVVNSTSVYTSGDTHISDMQLEVLGNDALRIMNTAPNSTSSRTPLQTYVETEDEDRFRTHFLNLVNNRTGSSRENLQFVANVTYERNDGVINSTPLSMTHRLYGGEHPVRVTEWVIVEKRLPGCMFPSCAGKHAVLVEVLIWRD